MRLRDMLAAAVRPWVGVDRDAASVTVGLGKSTHWGRRWSLTISDAKSPKMFLMSEQRSSPLIGDLCVEWTSRADIERKVAEYQARKAANDSKAAA